MKKRKLLIVAGLLVCMLATMLGLTACGDKEPMLTFVAADKTNYDKEITFTPNVDEGQTKYTYTYTFALKLNADGKASLEGTCKKKAAPTTNQGGGGNSPFPGQASIAAVEAKNESEDLSGFNFKSEGTWEAESGPGYKITFENKDDIPSGKEIHTNYDKYTGRHYFYADVAPTINGKRVAATQIQFQAKDSEFGKTLPSDYKTYEERTAKYAFSGASGNGMVAFYMLDGGKVFMQTTNGSSSSVVSGATWSENASAKEVTLTVNGKNYASFYCGTSGKEGYRINYNGTDCFSASHQYTNQDFEGNTLYSLTGSYKAAGGFPGASETTTELVLTLTDKGYAVIRNAKTGATVSTGKYTKTGEDISVDVGKGAIAATKTGDSYTVSLTISVSVQRGPSVSVSDYKVDFVGGAA